MNNTHTAPTSTVTTTDLSDPRALFATAASVATPIIDAVSADQYSLATPCGSYNVRELLGHMLFVAHRVAGVGRNESQFDNQHIELIESNDFSTDWQSAVADVAAAWSNDSRLADAVELPWATMTGGETLQMWASELTTHTWDLATATGQQPQWNPDVVQAAVTSIHRDLPLADRSPMWAGIAEQMPEGVQFDPPFANAVPVADDAPMIEQLVAWTGRQPR